MTIKEDLLRVLEYGKDPYYYAITAQPSYAVELAKVTSDFKGRSWIESPFKLPRFTDQEFEEKRTSYQAKYGNVVNIPGFNDIIHWSLPTRITAERMAAHRYAQKRGLPSPLSPEELKVLTYKKARFLKSLASATPSWIRNVGAVQTVLDNAEDALVTAVVIARIAAKFAPRLLGIAIPYFGWVLLGSEIINLGNIIAQVSFAANAKKRNLEYITDKNPFHKKAWANRTRRLKRIWPTLGEILEIAQTTDQVFGVGVCLGGIVGLFQDLTMGLLETSTWEIASFVERVGKPSLIEQQMGRGLYSNMAVLASEGFQYTEDAPKTLLSENAFVQGVKGWWHQEGPLDKIIGMAKESIHLPMSKDPAYRYILEEMGYDPDSPGPWPIIGKQKTTVEEVVYTYAPRIKENFQDYALRHKNEWSAMVAAQNAQEYHETIVSMFSDDENVRLGRSAYANAAIDMAREILLIPPDTPQRVIDQLSNWIGEYERRTGESPKVKDIEWKGKLVGIDWQRTFPKVTFGKAAELFPEWRAIQDQLGELYIAD